MPSTAKPGQNIQQGGNIVLRPQAVPIQPDKILLSRRSQPDIAVMKTHIINYSKTRDVYVAYRKAGYSKKFKAEHESDILLHQAAKKFFDGSGLKKLPTVKSLQAEYAAHDGPIMRKMNVPPPGETFILLVGGSAPKPP